MSNKSVQSSANPTQLPFLAVVTVFACALALFGGVATAEAEGELQVEAPDRALHHQTSFKVEVSGLKSGDRPQYLMCYAEQTGKQCETATVGYHRGYAQALADRLLVHNGKVIDCADAPKPCWLEVRTKKRVGRAQLNYSAARPLPEVVIDAQPIALGATVKVSTNEYLGDPADLKQPPAVQVSQCPTDRNPASKRDCIFIYGFLTYGRTAEVRPHRSMVVGRDLVDCAATPGACEIVLNRVQRTGTPIIFESASALPPETVELSKSTGLKNYEQVDLQVKSSLSSGATVQQCIRRQDSTKPFCAQIDTTSLQGRNDPTGEAISTVTIRPSRYLLTRKAETLDCLAANSRCFVQVKAEPHWLPRNQYRVGKRIPISFDPDEQVTKPQVTIPNGPFVDGQIVEVEFTGLAPSTRFRVYCQRNSRCKSARGKVDETGAATINFKLVKNKRCTEPAGNRCNLLVTTEPQVNVLRLPISFE